MDRAMAASKRVALWRRLKGLGAVYLQNGVCLLPKTDDHVRRLKMLENDVAEGALTMGQWQRVLMAELDGPRKRGLVLQVLAAS